MIAPGPFEDKNQFIEARTFISNHQNNKWKKIEKERKKESGVSSFAIRRILIQFFLFNRQLLLYPVLFEYEVGIGKYRAVHYSKQSQKIAHGNSKRIQGNGVKRGKMLVGFGSKTKLLLTFNHCSLNLTEPKRNKVGILAIFLKFGIILTKLGLNLMHFQHFLLEI